jgi:hypothetical protein
LFHSENYSNGKDFGQQGKSSTEQYRTQIERKTPRQPSFCNTIGTRTGENACFQRDNFTPAALKQLFSGTVILFIFYDKTKVGRVVNRHICCV